MTTTTDRPSSTRTNAHRPAEPVNKIVRLVAILSLIAGAILTITGAGTWVTVQSSLAAERITVSDDSPRFAGDAVDGPFTAYQEAQMIEKHYLESTEGKTYAELDREDPLRATAMNASFLRASLFTSVVAFGVAALATGLGIMFLLIGVALRSTTRTATRAA